MNASSVKWMENLSSYRFTTFNADKSIKLMAIEINDTYLPMKVAHGVLVAIEAKYHFKHLTIY